MWLNTGKLRRKKFCLTKMNPFTVFFKDFDHKVQDPFLNKSQRNYPKFTNPVCRAIKLIKGEYDILRLSLLRSYRLAGYKQFSWQIHNRLAKGVRKVIPSCALWSIRERDLRTTRFYPKNFGN